MRRAHALTGVVAVVTTVAIYSQIRPKGAANENHQGRSEDSSVLEWWREARRTETGPLLDGVQREQLARLEAMGYVAGSVEAGAESGVTRHDPRRAQPGLNLYTSGHMPGAVLMDMDGRVLHRWRKSFQDLWPEYPNSDTNQMTQFWRRTFLLEGGDVLANFGGLSLVKLDKNSEVLWKSFKHEHHDLEIMPNGDIWVLTREPFSSSEGRERKPFIDDFITILDRHGNEKDRVSFRTSFLNSDAYRHIWMQKRKKRRRRGGDILHTNTLRVLDGSLAGRLAAFRSGNVLFSCRNASTIGVLDVEREEVVWALRGPFRNQHDPKVLANGNLLLFNNMKTNDQSSVMEIDPVTGQTIWEFAGSPDSPFFSSTHGMADRLANGNTLIVESNNGRAFEVTPEKEIVWEFYNPERVGADSRLAATLFDLVRLPGPLPEWLE
jgi:outer membrane protein assembly factor BamB